MSESTPEAFERSSLKLSQLMVDVAGVPPEPNGQRGRAFAQPVGLTRLPPLLGVQVAQVGGQVLGEVVHGGDNIAIGGRMG